MPINHVIVVGAGAMGSYFAARLTESGTNVSLIDVDDARLALIASNGITIDDSEGLRTVKVVSGRADLIAGQADLIILFTKGAHSRAAIASVAHMVGPETRALTLQNGVGNAETIAAVVNPARILMGITDIPCDLIDPTSVASHGHGHIALGAYASDDPTDGQAVTGLLLGAGFDVTHDPAVRIAVWEKIAFNAAMNAICAVTTLVVGQLDTPSGRRVIGAVVQEVVAVAQANGILVDPARIADKINHALANHVHHKPSMLQDRLAGRQSEIETINGAVVREGVVAGVTTPVNQILADLMRTVEAAR